MLLLAMNFEFPFSPLKPVDWLEKVLIDSLGWSAWVGNQDIVCELAEIPSNRLGSISRSIDKHRWASIQGEPCRKILFGSELSYLSDDFDREWIEKNQSLLTGHGDCMQVERIFLG